MTKRLYVVVIKSMYANLAMRSLVSQCLFPAYIPVKKFDEGFMKAINFITKKTLHNML